MDRAAYINDLMNREWTAKFSCWQMVRAVKRDLFGLDLPEIPEAWANGSASIIGMAFAEHEERREWQEIAAPADGCIVLFKRMTSAAPEIHCGVYLDKGIDRASILHCDFRYGVALDMISVLRIAWPSIAYYEKK